ncbi:MAG: HDIG domain-containing metalloprotein [Victivallales bacterium]
MLKYLQENIFKRFKRRELEKKGLIQSRKRLKQGETLGNVFESSKTIWIFILVSVWAVCVAVMLFPRDEDLSISFLENQQATSTVFADFDFSYIDPEKTRLKTENTVSEEPSIYKIDVQSTENVLNTASEFFQEFEKRISNKEGETYNPIPDNKVSIIVSSLPKETVNSLSTVLQTQEKRKIFLNEIENILGKGLLNPDDIRFKQPFTLRIIDEKGRLRKKSLQSTEMPVPDDASMDIARNIAKYYSPENRKAFEHAIKAVISEIIRPNLIFNSEMTEQMRKNAEESVSPVKVEVKRGNVIIEKGKNVDKESIQRFQAYKQEKESLKGYLNFWKIFINASFICLFLMIISGIYMYYIHPEVVRSNQKIALLGTVVIINLILNTASIKMFHIFGSAFNLPPVMTTAVLPLAMTSVVLSVIIGLRAAIYAGLFVSLIASFQMNNSFHVLLSGMIVSVIAGIAVRNSTNHRSYFLRGALAVCLLLPPVEAVHLWSISEKPDIIVLAAAFSAATGIIVIALSLILTFILEMIFQISTDMSLLILCDYNHPLLKRLQLEAPGTYHHSIVVSTLAEHAAQDIGANSIRARVCALFHDIGKLTTPQYFIENNMGEENKHDDLNPRMSSLVILNHVKDGVDMAIKYKLRKIIRDAIEQHHGTDLVMYFYQRAVDEGRETDSSVSEIDYRYPGPLPREKEVVIVSLADSCEAASRTLQKPSPSKIDSLVWEILRKRIRDGQLNDAELTFGELSKIRQSFVKTLTTMMHGRVTYPKDEENEDYEDDLFQAAKTVSNAVKKDNEKDD